MREEGVFREILLQDFFDKKRLPGESACQGRANNVAAVRRPSVLSDGTIHPLLTVGRVV